MPMQYGQQPGDEAKATPAFECDIDTKIETTGAHWKAAIHVTGRFTGISRRPPPSNERVSEEEAIGSDDEEEEEGRELSDEREDSEGESGESGDEEDSREEEGNSGDEEDEDNVQASVVEDETTNEVKTRDGNADIEAFVKGDVLPSEVLQHIAKELAAYNRLDAVPPVVSASHET
jgi:hypothetical protein